ncbi:hypothetical protein CVV72_10365 [Amycolatopsis sp. TNS106]|nr:hypothetical protein CVV72_10365 [Amycolatopsis sp. TNS106]
MMMCTSALRAVAMSPYSQAAMLRTIATNAKNMDFSQLSRAVSMTIAIAWGAAATDPPATIAFAVVGFASFWSLE